MEHSEFSIEKTKQDQAELNKRDETRHAPTKYLGTHEIGQALAPGSDSLLDYWHILFRHRTTLLKFTLVGLLAELLISLVQTPIYRVRTSLEIQSANLPEMKEPRARTNGLCSSCTSADLPIPEKQEISIKRGRPVVTT